MGKLLKKLIQILFSSLLMILLTACGSDKGEKSNEDISQEEDLIGEVVIKLEGKTYKLELAKCWRPKGQNIFLIHSKKNKDKPKTPFFTSQGGKGKESDGTDDAYYAFHLDGLNNGGTMYSGEMHFDLFKNNELSYKGETKSFNQGDGITAIRGNSQIEFKVTCF